MTSKMISPEARSPNLPMTPFEILTSQNDEILRPPKIPKEEEDEEELKED
jgi:hypothetical protein